MAAYSERITEARRNTRFIAYVMAKAFDSKNQVPPMHKFWPLPGDEEALKNRLERRRQEYAEAKEQLKKRANARAGN